MHPRVSGFHDGRPSTLPPPIRKVGWYPIIVHAQEFLSRLTKLKTLAEAWGGEGDCRVLCHGLENW